MGRNPGVVRKQLEQVFRRGAAGGLGEDQLLERFAERGDEAAFAALIARHGPMVWGVCRRVLRDERDVEDAFQATFLVLVRRAKAIRDGVLVGHWLYGVARRVAVRARANAARRFVHETEAGDVAEPAAPADVDAAEWAEMRAAIDEELARLPGSLRAPVVLCYLDGLTHDEAARRLRWPVGTVRSRMARARDLLRRRLSRRGVTLGTATLAAALAPEPVPAALLSQTLSASVHFATRQAAAAAVTSAAALARGVLHAMTIAKIQVLGAAALAGAFALGGVQIVARTSEAGDDGPKPSPAAAAPASKPAEANDEGSARLLKQIEDELKESGRRDAALQKALEDNEAARKELENLRAALKSQRRGAPPRAEGRDIRLPFPPGPGMMPHAGANGMMGKPEGAMGFAVGGPVGMTGAPMGPIAGGPGAMTGFSGGMIPTAVGPGAMGGGTGEIRGMGSGPGGMVGLPGGIMPGPSGPGGMRGVPGRMMPGPMGTGMVETFGGNAGKPPRYISSGQIIVVTSPKGDQVTAYSTETGQAKSYRLTGSGENRRVTPLVTQGLAALYLVGDKIDRVAAFSAYDGNWYPQVLREPVDKAMPLVNANLAAYGLGRRIYAFSAVAKRWDVLELPEGTDTSTVGVSHDWITFVHDDRLHVFSGKTGKWEAIRISQSGDDADKDAEGDETP